MKVIFFGTPVFAANILDYLIKNQIEVVAVVTRPDKPKGRSGDPVPNPVKLAAQSFFLPIFQPISVSSPEFVEILRPYQADLFVVVAFGEIIKQNLLDLPSKGCINVHGSLLPKYRGAAPIQRCIINGETETGITIMHMVRKMDAGDMIKAVKVPIGIETTFGELESLLCQAGKEALLDVIHEFERGVCKRISQDEAQVTYAPKIELEDCQIDWGLPAQSIHNLVRGVNPYPGAWCYIEFKGQKKRLKILKTRLNTSFKSPKGSILPSSKDSLIIACGDNALEILELQMEGKKTMTVKEFTAGISKESLSFNP